MNEETMILNLRRIEVLDLKLCLMNLIFDFTDELGNATTEWERDKLRATIDKWQRIADKIDDQFELQDLIIRKKYDID